MGPLVQPLNRKNRHLEVILGLPERRRHITRHGGVPAAPIHPRAGRN
jgi:hypothetical protein